VVEQVDHNLLLTYDLQELIVCKLIGLSFSCMIKWVPNHFASVDMINDEHKADTLPKIGRLSNTCKACHWIRVFFEVFVKQDEQA